MASPKKNVKFNDQVIHHQYASEPSLHDVSEENPFLVKDLDQMPVSCQGGGDGQGIKERLQSLKLDRPPQASAEMRNLCQAMTHLETKDFADGVINVCNHITSLVLNEIDSLCMGMQKASINDAQSITRDISILSHQIKQMEVKDIGEAVHNLSVKLSDCKFYDYNYPNFISVNQVLTRISDAFMREPLNPDGILYNPDIAFRDQYQLTCKFLRYILTTSPPDRKVLTTYLEQFQMLE